MKLIVAIVQLDDASPVVGALSEERLSATIVEARGGFLHEGVAAILIGLDDRLVSRALTILGRYCKLRRTVLPDEFHEHGLQEWPMPEVITAEVGGATAFVLPVVRFERF